MERKPISHMTAEELDATTEDMLVRARNEPEPLRIMEATYHAGHSLDLFVLNISDGRRLILPREELQFVSGATPEEAADFRVGQNGLDIWWAQLDEGFRLEGLLEGRYGNSKWMERLHRRELAA